MNKKLLSGMLATAMMVTTLAQPVMAAEVIDMKEKVKIASSVYNKSQLEGMAELLKQFADSNSENIDLSEDSAIASTIVNSEAAQSAIAQALTEMNSTSVKSISWNGGFTFTTEETSYHFAHHDVAVEANEFDEAMILISGGDGVEAELKVETKDNVVYTVTLTAADKMDDSIYDALRATIEDFELEDWLENPELLESLKNFDGLEIPYDEIEEALKNFTAEDWLNNPELLAKIEDLKALEGLEGLENLEIPYEEILAGLENLDMEELMNNPELQELLAGLGNLEVPDELSGWLGDILAGLGQQPATLALAEESTESLTWTSTATLEVNINAEEAAPEHTWGWDYAAGTPVVMVNLSAVPTEVNNLTVENGIYTYEVSFAVDGKIYSDTKAYTLDELVRAQIAAYTTSLVTEDSLKKIASELLGYATSGKDHMELGKDSAVVGGLLNSEVALQAMNEVLVKYIASGDKAALDVNGTFVYADNDASGYQFANYISEHKVAEANLSAWDKALKLVTDTVEVTLNVTKTDSDTYHITVNMSDAKEFSVDLYFTTIEKTISWTSESGFDITIPAVEEPEYTLGDVNGDNRVNAKDATAILQYVAKMRGESEIVLKAADANADGRVNAKDATTILQYVAKKIPTLPPQK